MSTPSRYPYVSETALEELSQRGQALYEKFRPQVEPEHERRFTAIHVDTEDYLIAPSSGEAMRAILERHPADGRLYIRKIGSEPKYGLAARLLAGGLFA